MEKESPEFIFSGEGLTLDGARWLLAYIRKYGPRGKHGHLGAGLDWLVKVLEEDIKKYQRWVLTAKGEAISNSRPRGDTGGAKE